MTYVEEVREMFFEIDIDEVNSFSGDVYNKAITPNPPKSNTLAYVDNMTSLSILATSSNKTVKYFDDYQQDKKILAEDNDDYAAKSIVLVIDEDNKDNAIIYENDFEYYYKTYKQKFDLSNENEFDNIEYNKKNSYPINTAIKIFNKWIYDNTSFSLQL